MKFSEIVEKLKPGESDRWSLDLSIDPEIAGVAAVDEATAGRLSYIEGAKFANQVNTTAASALILPFDETVQAKATARGIAWVATAEPRLSFARAIAFFYQPYHPEPRIHPSAVIDPSAIVGENVAIGANVVIQARVKLGNSVCIHPNAVIYPDVEIGDRSVLHANCAIEERTIIGANCVVHSGAVIGGEGFGFVPSPRGWVKMEQSGRVVLEEGVEVGCNSAIDRPAVGETRVGSDTKIDNLVHIAHGCKIGKNCAFAAQVGLAGGVKVGDNVLLGGNVGVANQVAIGKGAIATAKSGIHDDVRPGDVVSGYPAVAHKIYLQASAIYKRLPEMYKFFRQFKRPSRGEE